MDREKKIPVVAVIGPTASGKTRLAVEIAERFNGEVVSADSMQIYRGMDIATAKPTREEMRGIPHYLLNCIDAGTAFSVADYCVLAHQVIADISLRGKLPVLAGGTGLYVDSVLDDIRFTEIKNDPSLREELESRAKREGGAVLLEELRGFDPETAQMLHPNNLGRIVRAVEIYRLTGMTMSQHRKNSRRESRYRSLKLGLAFADRKNLYTRIEQRVDAMMERGLLEEARQTLQAGNGKTSLQAIGCKEFSDYFSGEVTLEEAVEQLKKDTRHYAKRQLTWFRRDEAIHWFFPDQSSEAEMQKNIANLIENFLEM